MENWQQSTVIDSRAYEYVVKKYFDSTGTFNDPERLINYLREAIHNKQAIFGVKPKEYIATQSWEELLELIEAEVNDFQKAIYETIQLVKDGFIHYRNRDESTISDNAGEWTDIHDRGFIYSHKLIADSEEKLFN